MERRALRKFFQEHKCTPQERKELKKYLFALRIQKLVWLLK